MKKLFSIFSLSKDRNSIYIFLLLFVVILRIFGHMISPGFMSLSHLGVLLRQASFVGMASIGQTFVILTGGIDLSVGPLISMGNILVCELLGLYGDLSLPIIFLVLVLGSGIGLCNGLGVVYLRVPPIIMTLAMGSILEGITLFVCRGSASGYATPLLQYLGSKIVFKVLPIPFLISVIVLVIAIFLVNRTIFGRKVFAIGANEVAAYASGLNVDKIKILVYSMSGFTATLTGILLAGYTQTGYLGIGTPYTLSTIAAVVIGGTSIMGGEGGIFGTFLGAFVLILVKSLLTVMRMPEQGKFIVEGIIILTLIMFYTRKKRV